MVIKKNNNKGYTLVELLGAITLLGILSLIAVISVTKYKDKARNQAFETLADSAKDAMEEYMMDNPTNTEAMTFNKLYYEQYLERPTDAANSSKECTGTVSANKIGGSGTTLDAFDYTVKICCTNYSYQFQYSHDGSKSPPTALSASECETIDNITNEEKEAQRQQEDQEEIEEG